MTYLNIDFFFVIIILVYLFLYLFFWAVTYFPFHVGAVSPLAGTEEVQSATPIGERRPCGWGEAKGGTHTVLHHAGVLGQAKDLSGLPKGRVLVDKAAEPANSQHWTRLYKLYSYLMTLIIIVIKLANYTIIYKMFFSKD